MSPTCISHYLWPDQKPKSLRALLTEAEAMLAVALMTWDGEAQYIEICNEEARALQQAIARKLGIKRR